MSNKKSLTSQLKEIEELEDTQTVLLDKLAEIERKALSISAKIEAYHASDAPESAEGKLWLGRASYAKKMTTIEAKEKQRDLSKIKRHLKRLNRSVNLLSESKQFVLKAQEILDSDVFEAISRAAERKE